LRSPPRNARCRGSPEYRSCGQRKGFPLSVAGLRGPPRGCLSWGCPKIAPPPCSVEESTPGSIAAPFGADPARICPCSALVVFRHLDGLLLPARASVLQLAAGHGVRHVLRGCETARPVAPLCPPKPFSLPAASTTKIAPRCPAGVTATFFPSRTPRTPPTLPSRPFSIRHSSRAARVQCGSSARGRNPRALLHQ
jgi:hypothetical protein